MFVRYIFTQTTLQLTKFRSTRVLIFFPDTKYEVLCKKQRDFICWFVQINGGAFEKLWHTLALHESMSIFLKGTIFLCKVSQVQVSMFFTNHYWTVIYMHEKDHLHPKLAEFCWLSHENITGEHFWHTVRPLLISRSTEHDMDPMLFLLACALGMTLCLLMKMQKYTKVMNLTNGQIKCSVCQSCYNRYN